METKRINNLWDDRTLNKWLSKKYNALQPNYGKGNFCTIRISIEDFNKILYEEGSPLIAGIVRDK